MNVEKITKFPLYFAIFGLCFVDSHLLAKDIAETKLNSSAVLKLVARDIAVAEVKVLRESGRKVVSIVNKEDDDSKVIGTQAYMQTDLEIVRLIVHHSNDNLVGHPLPAGKKISCLTSFVDIKGMEFVDVGILKEGQVMFVILEELELGNYKSWRLIKVLDQKGIRMLIE